MTSTLKAFSLLMVSLLLSTVTAWAQSTVTAQGRIIDETGEGVIGASVVVQGTTTGAVTDLDGNFKLDVPVGATLRVSFIGFQPQDFVINKSEALNVILSDFALNITGTYELAAVGTEAFEGNIDANLSGYTVNLPEGCSNIQMSITLDDNRPNAPETPPTYTWDITQTGTLPNFTISQDENGSLSLNRLSAIPTKGTKTLHLTTTYGEIDLSFDVTINVRSLVDDEWTKSTTPTAPAPIIVEL